MAEKIRTRTSDTILRPGTIDVGGPGPPPAVIRLRERKVADVLGRPIARARQAEILEALEFGVTEAPDGLDVIAFPQKRQLVQGAQVGLVVDHQQAEMGR